MSEWKETEFGPIPEEWEISTLGQICDFITDGSHSSPKPADSSYFMASVKDMRYNYFDFSNCKTISKKDFESLVSGNCSPQSGDILLSKDGANCLDLIFIYKQPEKIVLLSSIAIARLKKGFDSDFYRFFLLSPNTQFLMRNNFVSGSAIPRVVLKDFRNVLVPLIPLPEQLAIASVLSSLDDKIDLPHRQNATLEAMAETLFRQMMSEHDLQGLQDGQDCEGSVKSCQSINPENPVQDECEAGAEWKTKPLSSIADFLNGLACQKFPPKNDVEKLPVLKIKDLGSGITENSDWASTDIKPEYIVKNGDVFFAWSASLMVKIWNGEDCILNQHLFKVTSINYPKWFYYFWCKKHLANFIAKAASHATTMGHIKRGDLDEAMVLVPPENELKQMTSSIQPIMDKQIINNNQIRTLTALRDTLLPKLMSGEVRVEM